MLLVHAHPDDETIATGVTMAHYLAQGAQVTLVTCTLGEEGEVLTPGLEHLAASQNDALGAHRQEEMAAAMDILGVTDHRYLGGAGKFRDSGMMGEPSNERPDCFWQADLLEAASYLVEVIREVRPQVLVTYDDFGQYGHPDHIQAHRVAMYAQSLAAAPSFRPDLGDAWETSKIYWVALPKSVVKKGIDAFIAAGGNGFFGLEEGDDLDWATDDALVSTRIVALDQEPKKMAALRAHDTQVEQEGDFFAMSEIVGPEAMGMEYFRIVKGPCVVDDAEGYETDLFAGVAGS
jgi:N-acetyl-1-D-myo-inositol-2-amino-2-deoxy-alpha-D-glucopyranoside deacetylase